MQEGQLQQECTISSGMSAAAMLTSAGPPESVGKPATEANQQHAAGTQDARDTRNSMEICKKTRQIGNKFAKKKNLNKN